jgi:hypothetical protein
MGNGECRFWILESLLQNSLKSRFLQNERHSDEPESDRVSLQQNTSDKGRSLCLYYQRSYHRFG